MQERIRRVYVPMTETGFYILFCLQKEMHGYSIGQQVEKMTGGAVKTGIMQVRRFLKWKRTV